ncbi:MAG: hypothetical protein IGS50_06495 [Synechococcales cyanobacterium C42_A2020_086]|jgi:hypothetical protein|nr:hypothetical protein [Synechococcales cyanobacterium C42_A2020_086]
MLTRLLQATLITAALHLILGIQQPVTSSSVVVLQPYSPSADTPLAQLLSQMRRRPAY